MIFTHSLDSIRHKKPSLTPQLSCLLIYIGPIPNPCRLRGRTFANFFALSMWDTMNLFVDVCVTPLKKREGTFGDKGNQFLAVSPLILYDFAFFGRNLPSKVVKLCMGQNQYIFFTQGRKKPNCDSLLCSWALRNILWVKIGLDLHSYTRVSF